MNYDYQFFAEHIKSMSGIISVEVFPDGSYGNIRLVTANDAFIHVPEQMLRDIGESGQRRAGFVPDQPYEQFLPKNKDFEEFCYRSAILGETLHTYIQPEAIPVWLYLTAIPLKSDKPNIGYCAYLQSYTVSPDYSLMSNIAPELAATVLAICMKLRSVNDFMTAIHEIIVDIRDLCDAGHCCILMTDFIQRKCAVLCEALSKHTNLTTMKKYVDDAFFSVVETWPATIGGSTCAVIKTEQDWKHLEQTNPVWYHSIQPAGAKNIVLFPLKYRGEYLGFIWAINFSEDSALKIKEALELTAFILGSELYSYKMMDRLQILSSTDMLTGVMNRNEMNNFVDSISESNAGKPVGVLFADLNGLKTVNDAEGHAAGDRLLKRAACALREVFETHRIFRAGGDEFVVILTGLSEDVLIEKAEALRTAAMQYDDLVFAVGTAYADDSKDIHQVLRLADERMYADKKRYYALHPEKKRGAQ